MELLPRITRAQPMDALSAMSTVSGYKAVLIAAERLPKFFPLLMTAAGTVNPARVFVIGAGVAGLQAIGTARRLGAVVEAYDTRPAVKEQVESLGAKFAELPLDARMGRLAQFAASTAGAAAGWLIATGARVAVATLVTNVGPIRATDSRPRTVAK